MALYQKHHNHKTFSPWRTEKCTEAEISCFVLRRSISPRGSMWFVGVQTCATFCRPPFIQTCWNRLHKWWCRHILGPKIKMRHKTVPNYMPARGQDIGLSRNTFSKKDWHMDVVLLHLELSLNFSRHRYPARQSSYEHRTLESYTRNTDWRFTGSRMSLEALDISETDK